LGAMLMVARIDRKGVYWSGGGLVCVLCIDETWWLHDYTTVGLGWRRTNGCIIRWRIKINAYLNQILNELNYDIISILRLEYVYTWGLFLTVPFYHFGSLLLWWLHAISTAGLYIASTHFIISQIQTMNVPSRFSHLE
jgi:hypothetical protein